MTIACALDCWSSYPNGDFAVLKVCLVYKRTHLEMNMRSLVLSIIPIPLWYRQMILASTSAYDDCGTHAVLSKLRVLMALGIKIGACSDVACMITFIYRVFCKIQVSLFSKLLPAGTSIGPSSVNERAGQTAVYFERRTADSLSAWSIQLQA